MTSAIEYARDRNMGKLRGYDFYRAIGSPTRIVAPMVVLHGSNMEYTTAWLAAC